MKSYKSISRFNWSIRWLPLCLIFFIFEGCQHFDDTIKGKTIFRYNESAGITSLDPAYARDQANIWAVHQLFNGLVQLTDKLGVEPCIAKSWNISENGLVYTFHLRNDVYFHPNPVFGKVRTRKVVSEDFRFSLSRLTDGKVASPGSWVLNSVEKIDGICNIQTPDDTTLVIKLSRPFPPFLGLLSTMYCSVVPKEAVTFYGQDFRKNPVGTGPFSFKLWKEGIKLVLLKNPDYFEFENGIRLPYLDAVSITFLADKQSAFLEFLKGRIDFMSGIDVSYKDELLSSDGTLRPKYKARVTLTTQPYLNTEYFGFLVNEDKKSETSNPLLKKEVRQALNYAVNRKKMIRFLRNNIGIPATGGIVPRGLPSFDSNKVYYEYNLSKARSLIASAGYNGDIPVITLSTTPDYLDIAKYLQHQFEEIGLQIKIDVLPPAAMKEMKAQSKLPFFRASWIADYPEAENYLSLFCSWNFCPKGPNYTHFSNPRFDSLYLLSMKIVDNNQRYKCYQEMESIIMEEAPVLILYYDEVFRFTHGDITGLGGDPMNLLTLKRARKSKKG